MDLVCEWAIKREPAGRRDAYSIRFTMVRIACVTSMSWMFLDPPMISWIFETSRALSIRRLSV